MSLFEFLLCSFCGLRCVSFELCHDPSQPQAALRARCAQGCLRSPVPTWRCATILTLLLESRCDCQFILPTPDWRCFLDGVHCPSDCGQQSGNLVMCFSVCLCLLSSVLVYTSFQPVCFAVCSHDARATLAAFFFIGGRL